MIVMMNIFLNQKDFTLKISMATILDKTKFLNVIH